jgi:general secretion pathway protein N
MRRTLAFLWLVTIGAGGGFAAVGHAALPENISVQTEPKSSPRSGDNPLWGISLNSLTATRERPIFSPSRRALSPAPPVPVAAPAPAPQVVAAPEEIPLQLVGTIVGRENGIAICVNPSTRDVIRLKTGEDFNGWVLRAVQGREASFEKANLQARLTLPSPDDPQDSTATMGLPPPPPIALPTTASASGTWRDGDGQLISPPSRPGAAPVQPIAAQVSPLASGTWKDGDGQIIAPPKPR